MWPCIALSSTPVGVRGDSLRAGAPVASFVAKRDGSNVWAIL